MFGSYIAHRGLHDLTENRAENSIESALKAASYGLPVEIDIQLSRDGHAIVFHDDEMMRLTGHEGFVRDYDAKTLSEITLLGSDNKIPLLKDFLKIHSGKTPLLIELKDQSGMLKGSDGRLEKAVVKALQHYQGEVSLMSFNPDQIEILSELGVNYQLGLVTDAFIPFFWPHISKERLVELAQLEIEKSPYISFISHNIYDLENPKIAHLKERISLYCWTARTQKEAQKALTIASSVTFEGFIPDV